MWRLNIRKYITVEKGLIDRIQLLFHQPILCQAATVPPSSPANTHKTIKNIVLVPYTPKPNEWGSWQVKKSQLASSTIATPISEPEQEQQEEEDLGQVSTEKLLFAGTSTGIL